MRGLLVLNKYKCPPQYFHYIAFTFALLSGSLFWVTVNATRKDLIVQLMSGFVATTSTWVVYVVLVNEHLVYPSRQQSLSWFFHLITETCILLQVRLILR